VENLVKPLKGLLLAQLAHSMAEINPVFVPVYSTQLDIIDTEVEKL
jgi:hypothetical protein